MLQYHMKCNQKGWVCALPQIRFQIMNTVNASTGFSGFQLHLGCSPCIIPPIVPSLLPVELADTVQTATSVINRLKDDVADAHDNLLLSKISQTHYDNSTHCPDPSFKIGDMVMLSTDNC
jgi:hypothetical protein